MRRKLLSFLKRVFPLFPLLAGACAVAPTHAQGYPAQWSYSFVNNVGTATYPGNATVLGTTTLGTITTGSQTANTIFAAPDGASGGATFRTLASGDFPLSISINPTYGSLNATQYGLKYNIGACLSTDYVGGAPGNFSTTGVAGCVNIPAGTYTGTLQTWPDAGVAGYAIANTVGKSAVGLFGNVGQTIAGAYLDGGNISAVNCRLYIASCSPSGGFDFASMHGMEVDLNIYSKSGSIAPGGAANAVIAQLNSDIVNTGALNGFDVVGDLAHSTLFKSAYSTEAAAANVGLFLNSVGTSSSTSASQPIQFTSRVAGTPSTSSISVTSGGILTLTPASSISLAAPTAVSGVISSVVNISGTLPATCTTCFALGDNFYGREEVNIINTDATGGHGFDFIQMTGAGAGTDILRIERTGTIYPAPQTFSQLPTCNAGASGAIAYITDASAAISAWHQSVTAGGGANKAIVACNGTNWLAIW